MEINLDKAGIQVLFIDIGGVLLTNGWSRESRQAAASQFAFDFSEMDRRHELVFAVYEQGGLTLDAYLDTIVFYKDRPFTRQAFRAFMFQQSQALGNLLAWFVRWKESHPHLRFFSLNNEPKELHAYRVEEFNLRRLYDGFIASCDVGLRKPDPAIYALAAGIAGVQPSQCLYIDDRETLVEAGRKAGLNGWTHQNEERTIKFLTSMENR